MTAALRASAKGARIISAGIHMSDIPAFPYEMLWGERMLGSVANLTRQDGEEFLALAPQVPVRTEVEVYPLEEANEALDSIRSGSLRGAAVLQVVPEGFRLTFSWIGDAAPRIAKKCRRSTPPGRPVSGRGPRRGGAGRRRRGRPRR